MVPTMAPRKEATEIFLNTWQELQGSLKSVHRQYDTIIFNVDDYSLGILSSQCPSFLKNKPQRLIGKRIKILRTDLINAPFLARYAENKKEE